MNLAALNRITYGMYILSARQGERFNGQIVNTVVQVTAQPCQIGVVVNKKNLTHEYVESSRAFAISILEQETPLKFIGLFGFNSGRQIDKFRQAQHKIASDGLPIVTECTIGYLECRLDQSIEAGTHTIFIGQVTNAETLKDAPAMTYAYYHDVKRGQTHQNAPTYVAQTVGKEKDTMASYRCTICNYIYDPKAGDPDAGIKPGTAFESLPAEWVCPICGAGKDKFVKVE